MSSSSSSSSSQEMTPLPTTQLWVSAFVQITEGMNTNILFPFMAFMTEDFGYTGHRLGIYAGMMAATFSGAQFCSSILWGIISDRYGRKAAIVYGVVGAAAGMAIFGSAKTYTQAIIGRAIAGFLSGNLGIIKSFLTEITDKSNRSKAFSLWSLASTSGNILGPLMGGYLCKPADKYPNYFSQDGVFGRYPYFLPCFVAVVLDVLCGIYCLLFMVETRWKNSSTASGDEGPESSDKKRHSTDLLTPRSSVISFATFGGQGEDDDELDELEGLEEKKFNSKSKLLNEDDKYRGDYRKNSGIYIDAEIELSEINNEASKINHKGYGGDDRSNRDINVNDSSIDGFQDIAMSSEGDTILSPIAYKYSPIDNSMSAAFSDDSRHGFLKEELDDDNHDHINNRDQVQLSPKQIADDKEEADKNHATAVLKSPKVIWSTTSYGAIAMAFVLLDETLPLLLKQKVEEGGFSFSSSDIGTALSLSTFPLFLFSFFFLAKFCSGSKLELFEKYNFLVIPVIFIYPTLAYANNMYISKMHDQKFAYYLTWGVLLAAYTMRNIFATLSFSGIIMLINNSAAENDLGIVNGLGQSMASGARCLGPAFGGALWSLSVRIDFLYLNFIIVTMIILCAIRCGRLLPRDIDYISKDGASASASHE